MMRNTPQNSRSSHPARKHFMSDFETHSTLLMAALVLGAASCAHAQTGAVSPASPNSPPSHMSPSATSPAADGAAASVIPRNKVTSKDLDAIFLQADTSKDGKLDRRETESLPIVSQSFEQLDSNRDGFISRAEFSRLAGT